MNAENILNKNKLLVDVYIAQLEGYKAELTAELQNGDYNLMDLKQKQWHMKLKQMLKKVCIKLN